MAYDEKYKARAVGFKDSGRAFKELRSVFGIGSQTYYRWKVNKETTGFYAPKFGKIRRKRKIDPEELLSAIKEKPDAYLRELAEKFNCSINAIHKRLKELKVTLKKRPLPIRKSQKSIGRNISKN